MLLIKVALMSRFFRKIFHQEMGIGSATFVIAMGSLLSRLLGVVRNRLFAAEFGAGDELDAYFAAFRVPDFLLNLLILGAFSAAFIPVFTHLISRKEKKRAFEIVNSVVNLVLVILIVISVIFFFLAPILMTLITPGFSEDKMRLTVLLTRIMLFSPIFLGLSTIFGGVLNSFRKFFTYALAPVMYNIGIIFGALFLVPLWGIYGLAVGVVVGALLHLLVQLPVVFGIGYRFCFFINLKDYYLIKIGKLMIPRALGLAVSQINLVVITIIASTLMSGSIAVFNFANDLQSLPVSIFGVAFATAVFPVLAASVSLNKAKKFVRSFSYTFRQIVFLIVPASVGLFLLRAQIVRIILGTGKFDWEDTYYTAVTLGLFCLGMIGQALLPLVTRAFFALHDTKTPVLISIITVAINVGLSLLFVRVSGVVGLALAFSLSSLINLSLLYLFLRRRIGNLNDKANLITFLKSLANSVVMGLSIYGTLHLVSLVVNMQKVWGVVVQGSTALIVGTIAYLVIAWIWECEEIDAVRRVMRRFLGISALGGNSR